MRGEEWETIWKREPAEEIIVWCERCGEVARYPATGSGTDQARERAIMHTFSTTHATRWKREPRSASGSGSGASAPT